MTTPASQGGCDDPFPRPDLDHGIIRPYAGHGDKVVDKTGAMKKILRDLEARPAGRLHGSTPFERHLGTKKPHRRYGMCDILRARLERVIVKKA
jgi:hypothetical protein